MSEFLDILLDNPIIGGIRNYDDLERVANSSINVVFVLFGTIAGIKEIADVLKEHNKIFFIHVDMIDGLKGDEAGIKFIHQTAGPYGIITTKQSLIRTAKSCSLKTILRIFMLDSKSFRTGLRSIEEFRPDAVEVLPGVSEKVIKMVGEHVNLPIIAGGLIETKEEVLKSLSAGAVAISSSKTEIWDF